MLKAVHYNTSECRLYPVADFKNISDMINNDEQVFWLDLQNPTEKELSLIAEEFQLHPLAIEDATHEHQRPKIEQYESFFFMVFYAVSFDKEELQLTTHELNMFVGRNYLITVHYAPLPELNEAERRWMRNPRHLEAGIGTLLYSVIDTIVDRYLPIVDKMVEKAEELEDRIFSAELQQDDFTMDMLALKKQFLEFRRLVAPERDVLTTLTNRESMLFSNSIQIYFRDVSDHLVRVADTIDLYRDQLTSTMDASLSRTNNQLSQVMRTLTVTSIILMSNSLIAGIYGMNFKFMPELGWQFGYASVLGLMIALSAFLWFYFKKLRWL